MSYLEKRNQIDLLQKKINVRGELSADVKNKINYKFRLDWNYYSNSMEGNTLTMDETRSVMVGNLTVGGKPIKDVLEIKGHDEVIDDILKIGKGELRLSEKRIKEIHKGIMYEEDKEKEKKIGAWKTDPNYVINYKGEKYEFAAPADVPERMHDLLNKTNSAIDVIQQNKKNAPHPIDVALQFHLDYVLVHPFYDGNGRTARILTNLLLISFGYPPFWVKTNERSIYNQYIGDIQGYGGHPDLFFESAADMILRSQQLVLDAIEGKEISEPEDLDKKISLLEKELEGVDPNDEVKVQLNAGYLNEVLHSWVRTLIKKAVPAIQKFNKFFTGTSHNIGIQNTGPYVPFIGEPAEELMDKLIGGFETAKDGFQRHATSITLNTSYGTLIKGGLKTFGCNYGFEIKFDLIKYEVFVDEFTEGNQRTRVKLFERLLHKSLTESEINEVVTKLTNAIFEHIDFNTKKSGLR
jgi:Fic family protein